MNCQTPWIGWLLHEWKYIMYFPPLLTDGAGGCWAGHRVKVCRTCGKHISLGIYAAEDTYDGKFWSRVRAARLTELEDLDIEKRIDHDKAEAVTG